MDTASPNQYGTDHNNALPEAEPRNTGRMGRKHMLLLLGSVAIAAVLCMAAAMRGVRPAAEADVQAHIPTGTVWENDGSFSVLKDSPRWDKKAIPCPDSGCLYEAGRNCVQQEEPEKLAGDAASGEQCVWPDAETAKTNCATWQACNAFWCDAEGCYARTNIEPVVSWGFSTALYVFQGFCNDEHNGHECYLWANSGECATNRDWMEDNCCASCDFTDGMCVDDPQFATSCGYWALKAECENDPVWMHQHCCRSCCLDVEEYRPECPGWQAEGKCESNQLWMARNCCGSCYHDVFDGAEPDGGDGDVDGVRRMAAAGAPPGAGKPPAL